MNDEEKELLERIQNLRNEMYAKFTVVQHALEVVIAEHLASLSPPASRRWKDDLFCQIHDPNLPDLVSPDQEQAEAAILDRSVFLAGQFVKNVATKEAEVRRCLAP